MIRGRLNHRCEPFVELTLVFQNGQKFQVQAMVDTGFNASLTLPKALIQQMNLRRKGSGTAALADGSVRDFDHYSVMLEWDGQIREVLSYDLGDEPLIGMRLLRDCELNVRVRPGGAVTIAKLS